MTYVHIYDIQCWMMTQIGSPDQIKSDLKKYFGWGQSSPQWYPLFLNIDFLQFWYAHYHKDWFFCVFNTAHIPYCSIASLYMLIINYSITFSYSFPPAPMVLAITVAIRIIICRISISFHIWMLHLHTLTQFPYSRIQIPLLYVVSTNVIIPIPGFI